MSKRKGLCNYSLGNLPKGTKRAVRGKSKRGQSAATNDRLLSHVFEEKPTRPTKVPAGLPVVALPDHVPAGKKKKSKRK
jgi:hypothetical protein